MIDFLINPCGQLLTLAGTSTGPVRGKAMLDLGVIENGALGINLATGNIEYVGRSADVDSTKLIDSCPVIDAGGCVVMPGFVDSHTHLVFAGSRADEFYRRSRGESYQSIAESGGGIAKTMAHTRRASPDVLLRLARERLRSLYDNGTTTVETKTGYGLDYESELEAVRVIRQLRDSERGIVMSTFLGAHLIPPEFKDDRQGYVDEVIRMLKDVEEQGLADFYDIFVDPLAFTLDEAKRIHAAAEPGKLGIKLHADEFSDNHTAAWGASIGALSCDHLGGIGREGIAALAQSDTVATLLPATMFFSGHGKYAPAREMIDSGCAVALATDLNPGSSLIYSMPLTMTFAVLEMGMSAEECIVASTINGAHALGLGGTTGSLEVGKRADVIIAGVPHYEDIPYHVGRDIIRDVFIRGRTVKRLGVMNI